MDQTNQSICPSVSAHRFFPLYLPTNFCPSFCPSLSANYFCPPFLLIILPIISAYCPSLLPIISAYHTARRFCPSFLPIILPIASAHRFCLSFLPIILPIASAPRFCLLFLPIRLPIASALRFCPSLLHFASDCHTYRSRVGWKMQGRRMAWHEGPIPQIHLWNHGIVGQIGHDQAKDQWMG